MFAPRGVVAVVFLCSTLASCTGSADRLTTSSTLEGSPSQPSETELAVLSKYSDEFCAYGVLETCCPRGAIPPSLRRALLLPALQAGEPCPVSIDRVVRPQYGSAMGSDPVNAVTPSAFHLVRPEGLFDTTLEMHKVLWLFHATYPGPVLVRGMGLSHDSLMGFAIGTGGKPFPELWVPPLAQWAADRAWVDLPSEVFFDGPGCYGIQIDTRLGSDVIVVQAREPL
jgi:hypothetical protein